MIEIVVGLCRLLGVLGGVKVKAPLSGVVGIGILAIALHFGTPFLINMMPTISTQIENTFSIISATLIGLIIGSGVVLTQKSTKKLF